MTCYLLRSPKLAKSDDESWASFREYTTDARARAAAMFMLGKRGAPTAGDEIRLYREDTTDLVYLGRAVYQGGIMPVWVPPPG